MSGKLLEKKDLSSDFMISLELEFVGKYQLCNYLNIKLLKLKKICRSLTNLNTLNVKFILCLLMILYNVNTLNYSYISFYSLF